MIVGLHHFALSTGCRLIAEGIETEAELGPCGRSGSARSGLSARPPGARPKASPARLTDVRLFRKPTGGRTDETTVCIARPQDRLGDLRD